MDERIVTRFAVNNEPMHMYSAKACLMALSFVSLLSVTDGLAQATGSPDQPMLKASGRATGRSLYATAQRMPDLTTALQLLTKSGLSRRANPSGNYTVFVPDNAAFSVLGQATLDEMLLPSSNKRLASFLAYHVIKGRITSDQLKDGQTLTNLTGQILVVHKQEDRITITDGRGTVADVIQGDIRATNGVIYTINKVLQRNIPSAEGRY